MGAPEFGIDEACIFAIRCLGLFCIEAGIAALVALLDLKRNGPTYRKHRKLPLREMPFWETAYQLLAISIYTTGNMMQVRQVLTSLSKDKSTAAADAAAFLVEYQQFWPFPMHLTFMCLATFQSPNNSKYILAPTIAFESGCGSLWILLGRRHYPSWMILLSIFVTIFWALQAVWWKYDPIEATEQSDPGCTQRSKPPNAL